MRIVFVSNFLNQHQEPLSDALWERTKGNYYFIETKPTPESFIKSGYPSKYENKPYLVKAHMNSEAFKKALALSNSADILIFGMAPFVFKKERARRNKIILEYSERSLKKGLINLLSPRLIRSQYYYHMHYYNKPIYKLCASAYTANDMYLLRAFRDKCYKWGYFTRVDKIDIDHIIKSKQDSRIKIIWCARFINWKHPELAVELAKKLKENGYDFELNMIGSGPLYNEIKKSIEQYGLKDNVKLLGNIPNDKVLDIMKEHHIHVFTSDRNEGWGAVLNESMSNGCCPVASHLIGAAPYLIKHGENGLLFESENINSLYSMVSYLIDNSNIRNEMSSRAYKTISEEWSPEIAASNLIELSDSLLNSDVPAIESGPCSKAVPTKIKNILLSFSNK